MSMTLTTLLPYLKSHFSTAEGKKQASGAGVLLGVGNNMSLVEYTKDLRAVFTLLLDETLEQHTYLGDILHNALNISSAYYLQAINVDNKINGVRITDRLNKVNPNRSGHSLGNAAMLAISAEDYDSMTLPDYRQLKKTYSMEAISGMDNKYGETVRAYESMLIGKNLAVELSENGDSATALVNVRLDILGAPPSEIADIFSLSSLENTSKQRKYRFRAGQLKYIRDMWLCEDLIVKHRQTLLKEKSGFYAATLERRKKNALQAIQSGQVSVANASSIIVVSNTTADKLEAELGGKLSDQATRERMFQSTSAMLLLVVNTKWERVTMYTKSLRLPTDVSIRNIVSANKKDNGEGILEALQKLMMGKPL